MTVTPPENAVNPVDFDPTTDNLGVERTDSGLVVVTLNYPERRNAMSGPMTAAWGRLAAALRLDPSVRAVVVTEAGTAFC